MQHIGNTSTTSSTSFDLDHELPAAIPGRGGRTMQTHPAFESTIEPFALRPRRTIRRERVVAAVLPAALAALAAIVVLAQRPDIAFLLALTGVALVGGGLLHQRYVPKADTVVLIGRSPMAAVIASSIEARAGGQRSVAILRAVSLTEAATLVRNSRCDEVIIAGPVAQQQVDLVDARGVHPAVVMGAEKIERLLQRIPVELAQQDRWLSRLGKTRSLTPGFAFVKRATDLAFSLVLAIIVLPLIPLIALAIKLDSRGPVLYSQVRVGLGGRHFRIYKFRTMRQDAEKFGAVWAQARDPRVTRVGRFMRLTRFDELPQLWNVVRGDMAVVGPRPERPEFTETLAQEIPGYDLRHTVKPGLTGWAQVSYRYTNSVRDTKAKVEYDLFYVKHLSLAFDVKILVRTVKVVVGMKGQ